MTLGLKEAFLQDAFIQKYITIERENSDLKFENKLLRLQLNTLKNKKNQSDIENRFQICKNFFVELENQFKILVGEQERVAVRMNDILELLQFAKCDFQ